MKRVAFYPFDNKENQYINITKNIMQKADIVLIDFQKEMYHKKKCMVDAIYVNWYENAGMRKVIPHIRILIKCKLQGIKIFFVMHNKCAHEGKGKQVVKLLLKILFEISDKIVVLSKESEKYVPVKFRDKITYIPHPHYLSVYKESEQIGDKDTEKNGKMKMLFIGAIRPYKNIELLIECFGNICENYKNVTLTIAGKPYSDKYGEKLKKMTEQITNIDTYFSFISDQELPRLIKNHDILVLPYDIKSSLNSGTILLAFSLARTVIAPRIATIKEFDLDLTYSYEYVSLEEHKQELYSLMEKAILDFESSPKKIQDKGKKLLEIVKERNNEEVLASLYRKLFDF